MGKKMNLTYDRLNVSPTYISNFKEQFETLEYLDKVQYKNACRYKNLRTIRDTDTKKVHHESWNQKFINSAKSEDTYITVTTETENRLDLIAYNKYGSARYWWIIAMANYIIDPFDVPIGTNLRIPPIISLYKSGGVLDG